MTDTANGQDLFNKKFALRSLIGALWLFLSPINLSQIILGADHRTVGSCFATFASGFHPIIDRMNEELILGEAGMDVELDVRYIAIVRRGSAKVLYHLKLNLGVVKPRLQIGTTWRPQFWSRKFFYYSAYLISRLQSKPTDKRSKRKPENHDLRRQLSSGRN